jgi:aspartate 4-decarboxylase
MKLSAAVRSRENQANILNAPHRLSWPQQMQMARFSSFALLDKSDSYKALCQLIVRRRFHALFAGLGLPLPADGTRAGYYVELDLMIWIEKEYGPEFAGFLRQEYACIDLLFRLAERSGVVLMESGGLGGRDWSIRVSLANLAEKSYAKIGQYLREAARVYVAEWRAAAKQATAGSVGDAGPENALTGAQPRCKSTRSLSRTPHPMGV